MSRTNAERQKAYRDRKRGGPVAPPAECGTRAAAARARRNGETMCELCREAERAYMREAQARRRAAAVAEPVEAEGDSVEDE